MRLRIAVIATMLAASRFAHGQTAAEHIALGDRDHAALNITSALKRVTKRRSPSDPNNYDALVKAAYDAVDLGEFNESADQRTALYRSAEQYARRAVAANPNDPEGHFQGLARAIGRNALTMGTRDKIKYAGEVREQAVDALKFEIRNIRGAEHVMGVWNAEVMRLNGFSRMIAKNFLGGRVFDEASWDNALKYFGGRGRAGAESHHASARPGKRFC